MKRAVAKVKRKREEAAVEKKEKREMMAVMESDEEGEEGSREDLVGAKRPRGEVIAKEEGGETLAEGVAKTTTTREGLKVMVGVIGGRGRAARVVGESKEVGGGSEEVEHQIEAMDATEELEIAAGDEIRAGEREKAAEEVERGRPERGEAGWKRTEATRRGETEASEVAEVVIGAEIRAGSGGPRVAVVETLVVGGSLRCKQLEIEEARVLSTLEKKKAVRPASKMDSENTGPKR